MSQKNFTPAHDGKAIKEHEKGKGREKEDKLREKIASETRLSHDDRRTFAINLGKLAERLDPDKPLAGAKKIIEKSDIDGVQAHRKRFLRLPNEEAPPSSKKERYNANPRQSLALAKVAGELMSGAKSEAVVSQFVTQAYRDLAKGSSFLPTFSPETAADRSLKSLLDEYAIRLAEAIENRTKIIDLWKALDTSPIALEVFGDDEDDDVEVSPYGDAAIFPSELLQPMYRPWVSHGVLKPSSSHYDNRGWVEPKLELGIIAVDYDVRLFCVPKEKHELFEERERGEWMLSSVDETAISKWLHTIGFDFSDEQFPKIDYDRDGFGWKTFKVSLLHEFGLMVTRGANDEVEIQPDLWKICPDPFGSTDCLFTTYTGTGTPGLLVDAERSYVDGSDSNCIFDRLWLPIPDAHGNVEVDAWAEDNSDGYNLNLLKNFLAIDEFVAIMPGDWQSKPEFWADEEQGEEYQGILQGGSWADDPNVAKLLFGAENIRFYPKIPQSEPVASAARAGSVGASLLQNAATASDENRITKLLIDRVALTANSGLAFYEAMIDAHREAIRKI